MGQASITFPVSDLFPCRRLVDNLRSIVLASDRLLPRRLACPLQGYTRPHPGGGCTVSGFERVRGLGKYRIGTRSLVSSSVKYKMKLPRFHSKTSKAKYSLWSYLIRYMVDFWIFLRFLGSYLKEVC